MLWCICSNRAWTTIKLSRTRCLGALRVIRAAGSQMAGRAGHQPCFGGGRQDTAATAARQCPHRHQTRAQVRRHRIHPTGGRGDHPVRRWGGNRGLRRLGNHNVRGQPGQQTSGDRRNAAGDARWVFSSALNPDRSSFGLGKAEVNLRAVTVHPEATLTWEPVELTTTEYAVVNKISSQAGLMLAHYQLLSLV